MICSFVESSLTTYSTESSDFGNDEIHSNDNDKLLDIVEVDMIEI